VTRDKDRCIGLWPALRRAHTRRTGQQLQAMTKENLMPNLPTSNVAHEVRAIALCPLGRD